MSGPVDWELICYSINDDIRDSKAQLAIIEYLEAFEAQTARIAELETDLAETRRERDQYLSELMYLENGESM